MNREVAQSLQQLQSFMPTDAERRKRDKEASKASIEASSAYKRLEAKKANNMDTTSCLEQIDDLEKQLDGIINGK